MAVCKLCLQEKSLINKSHILPDATYQLLYDDKHKIRKFTPKDLLKENPVIQKPSSGIYEGGLLCADCDNRIIGGYETYGCKIAYARANKNPLTPAQTPILKNHVNDNGQRFNKVSNVDYKKFKLFLLSILWKASISTRPEFAEVDLGPSHTENIRRMLFEGDPGEVRDYPIRIQTYAAEKTAKDIILPPRKTRFHGHISYIFTITGFFYIFRVTHGQPIDKETEEHTLRPEGTFTILHVKKATGMEYLLKLSNALPKVNGYKKKVD